ncbi:SDR family NAD(P)-dependent oxidoreductase [Haladaptatus sp. F3-133]|uniref:SDR family NAD(P)-dependent oxidoreductase n=1 Tax=Halorutilus salinus TaxID=2487751 RepID=A0A9Q4C2M1_9EURY|nr:SDR family NAD(P)-dependent oxidoreductase [Halorutilus salinus]MCX2818730.1 SDR family NAD(P)-dependent oxidoreductase [Halorutilus salinus]
MGVLEEFRLDCKSSLVTGGASGIGRAFAEAMDEAGADVVVADIYAEGAEEVADEIADDTGRETLAVEADVTDEDNVETMVSETVDAFGGLDIAFANAGIAELERGAETYEVRQWNRIVDVNLTGVWLTDLYAARAMFDDGGGSVINTASVYGLRGSEALGYIPAYTASKGGVVNLTRTLGAEWAEEGVRVNAVAPSHVRTGIGGGALKDDMPGVEDP